MGVAVVVVWGRVVALVAVGLVERVLNGFLVVTVGGSETDVVVPARADVAADVDEVAVTAVVAVQTGVVAAVVAVQTGVDAAVVNGVVVTAVVVGERVDVVAGGVDGVVVVVVFSVVDAGVEFVFGDARVVSPNVEATVRLGVVGAAVERDVASLVKVEAVTGRVASALFVSPSIQLLVVETGESSEKQETMLFCQIVLILARVAEQVCLAVILILFLEIIFH